MPPSRINEERNQRLVRAKEGLERDLAEDRVRKENKDAQRYPPLEAVSMEATELASSTYNEREQVLAHGQRK